MKASFEIGMQPGNISIPISLYKICDDNGIYRNRQVKNSYVKDDWGYGEYQFSRYGKSKYGTYDSVNYYFSVAVFQLPRKLPNVFFDAHASGGREFKMLFRSSQKHSLESVFDNYFTTYFHESYTIDSLSFITPEVMESLIDASEYDIEIYEDKLYLYSELEKMPEQLKSMMQNGKAIKQKLLNNIITYRDERIDYTDGRRTVSMLGLSLQRSLTWNYIKMYIAAAILAGLIATLIWAAISEINIYGNGFAYATILAVSTCFRNYKKIKNVKREESLARSMINTAA